MTDTPTPTPDAPWTQTTTWRSYDVDADVIGEAVANGVTALEPVDIGQHGQAFTLPNGYDVKVLDRRQYDDERLPLFREGDFTFVAVDSLAEYVNRYKTGDSLGYITDVYGVGCRALTADLPVASVVIDDLPVEATSRRKHRAKLTLRPTTAARRWGAVLDGHALTQEAMLDLVVDGIGEIADPPGAELRDLISDLHAIRTTEAKSVIRTGGQAKIEVSDNVQLHAGTGSQVTVPERMYVVFKPYAGVDDVVELQVMIKPQINAQQKVVFTLSAPALDDQLASIVSSVALELRDLTQLQLLWVP